jgi:hypothetical protein
MRTSSQSENTIVDVSVVHVVSILRVNIDPSDGGSIELRNVDNTAHIHMV